MKRTFVKERKSYKYKELIQINETTGEVKIYCQDKELGFPFSEYMTSINELMWPGVSDFVKHLSKDMVEVDTQIQEKSELEGLYNLREYRKKYTNHGGIQLKDGTVYDDISERLKAYTV